MQDLLLVVVWLAAGNCVMGLQNRIPQRLSGDGRLMPVQEPPEEKQSLPGAFQSDMLLTPEQRQDLKDSMANLKKTGIVKRRAVRTGKWPKATIPYEIDSSFSKKIQKMITKTLDMWMEVTCLKFVPYSPKLAKELGFENRVHFQLATEGCLSWIGLINDIPQAINLTEKCDNVGTIAHEIGHAIGWYHEHARPDRNKYITINTEAILKGFESEFSPHEVETYGVPYDVGSIMHYGQTLFSKEGQKTIIPKNPLDQFRMGQRIGLSFYDKKLANLMYDCAAKCDSSLVCENDGYLTKECKCQCKVGYAGKTCADVKQEDASSGCLYKLTGKSGTFNSPGYPNSYPTGIECVWLIEGSKHSVVYLEFTDFRIEEPYGGCNDFVLVGPAYDPYKFGDKYCGTSTPRSRLSSSNQLLVLLSSDDWSTERGFSAKYKIYPPGEPVPTLPPIATTDAAPGLKTTAATITSPPKKCKNVRGTCGGDFKNSGCIASWNYGIGNYTDYTECVYNIEVPLDKRVEVTLLNMDIEFQESCTWDMLTFGIGDGVFGTLRMCGRELPPGSIVSLSNKMTLKMISDAQTSGKGFVAEFKAIDVA